MEIIWSHSSLCNMETTCSWISKAMTAAEVHIFFQYHCFEGGKMSPFWALLDHWFDSEPARKVCKSKGISEWFVSYFVNRVQIIKAKFPSVSNHFTYNLIPLQQEKIQNEWMAKSTEWCSWRRNKEHLVAVRPGLGSRSQLYGWQNTGGSESSLHIPQAVGNMVWNGRSNTDLTKSSDGIWLTSLPNLLFLQKITEKSSKVGNELLLPMAKKPHPWHPSFRALLSVYSESMCDKGKARQVEEKIKAGLWHPQKGHNPAHVFECCHFMERIAEGYLYIWESS